MKRFIQICSLLSLLVIFGAASANAQTGYGVEVEIPFGFNVGDHSYESGSYIVRVNKLTSGSATLSIQDTKNETIRTVLLSGNGDGPATDVKLVFDTIEGRRTLTRVRTPDNSYALVRSKAKDRVGERRAAAAFGGSANLF